MSQVIYQKDVSGTHFYRIEGENCLHVCVIEKDHTSKKQVDIFIITSEHKAGSSLINNLEAEDVLKRKHKPSTEEEFETALKTAIFNLNLYMYTKSL